VSGDGGGRVAGCQMPHVSIRRRDTESWVASAHRRRPRHHRSSGCSASTTLRLTVLATEEVAQAARHGAWLLAPCIGSSVPWGRVTHHGRLVAHARCVPFTRSSQCEALGSSDRRAPVSKRLIGEPHVLDAEGNFESPTSQSDGDLRSMWPASNGPFHPTMPGQLVLYISGGT
jgi:hypothetical protein